MTRRKIRIFCSPTFVFATMLIMLFFYGFYIFMIVYEPCREGKAEHLSIAIVWTIIALGTAPALILTGARRVYSIITIDEKGVSRSFLGRFYKLQISWEEMAEVCYKWNLIEYLFFSKTKKLSEMNYNKAIGVKDAIQISLSKRRYKVISQYLKQPVVGMPEKVLARLTKDNKQ